jgi:hypothetical protein
MVLVNVEQRSTWQWWFYVEGFSNFLHSGFIFAIGRLNKFSKCLSEVMSLKFSNYSLIHWLEKWCHLRRDNKMTFMLFDNVSIAGGCPRALSNTSKIVQSMFSALQYAFSSQRS